MKYLIYLMAIIMATSSQADPEPVLYGTVTDRDGQSFTGSIRWGKQETFLSDIFNAKKIKTVGIDYLSEEEIDKLEDHQPGPQATIGHVQITFKSFFGKDIDPPDFSVHFGAIKHIQIKAGTFTATLHDGTTIISDGDANDLTGKIHLKNQKGEQQSYQLNNLKRIDFKPAPSEVKTWGDGIYGTLMTDMGQLQGRIMWDKDERLTDEKLDGNQDGQEYDIKFSDIISIEKDNNASIVVLGDGKILTLTGTNDVNQSNRGIWLDHPDLGRVEINWQKFQKLTIEPISVDWLDFNDYAAINQPLNGTITTKSGDLLKAEQLIFDMNQQSEFEIIEVKTKDAIRQIPLRLVKKISVRNEQSVDMLMRDGTTLVAFGTHSVNLDNNGVVATRGKKHQWIQWKDIQSIAFE